MISNSSDHAGSYLIDKGTEKVIKTLTNCLHLSFDSLGYGDAEMTEYLTLIEIFDNNSYYFMKQTLILLLLLVASFAFTIEQKTQGIDQIAA